MYEINLNTEFFFLQTIFMTKSIHFLSYDVASNLSIDSTISFSLIVIFRALHYTEDNHIMYWTLMFWLTWVESSREHIWSSRRLFTFRIFIFFLKTRVKFKVRTLYKGEWDLKKQNISVYLKYLLFKINRANFNQTWHKASLCEGDVLRNKGTIQFSWRRYM